MSADIFGTRPADPIEADALVTALSSGLAVVRCPNCGSDDVRERNEALIWAPVDSWTLRGDTDALIPDEVDCSEYGDMDTAEQIEPYTCGDCSAFSGYAEDLVIELDGVRVAAPVKDGARSYWTDRDDERADAEGWGFFNDAEIQRCDESTVFTSDQAVWYHLARRARFGDHFASRALARVRREAPAEARRMYEALREEWASAESLLSQFEREAWLPAPEPEEAE